jgi:uncharacterized membrane protein
MRAQQRGSRIGRAILAAGIAVTLPIIASGVLVSAASGATIVALSPLAGFSNGNAVAVNGASVVVGESYDNGAGGHATLWRPAAGSGFATVDLGVLPGFVHGRAVAINGAGVIVGSSETDASGLDSGRATLWRPEPGGGHLIVDLGTLPGFSFLSRAEAINEAGVVVGVSWQASPGSGLPGHATLWRPDSQGRYSAIDLGVLPGFRISEAFGINAAGVVVGDSFSVFEDDHTVVWTPDGTGNYRLAELSPSPGNRNSLARAINSAGVVAGLSTDQSLRSRATLWTPDEQGGYTVTDLGTLQPVARPPHDSSVANALNSEGTVAGWSHNASGKISAALWKRAEGSGYTATELGKLPGTAFSEAEGINAAEEVVGSTTTAGDFVVHATVWRPA